MKREVYELTELHSQLEGTDLAPDYEQKMRDLRMRWEHADTAFYAGFYSLKRHGPSDAVTLSEDISKLSPSGLPISRDAVREQLLLFH